MMKVTIIIMVLFTVTVALPAAEDKARKRAPYHQGTTLTDAAPDFVSENKLFSTAKVARANAPDTVIVFTDGQSTYPEKKELQINASSDDDVFLAPTFGLLNYIEQTLSQRISSGGA